MIFYVFQTSYSEGILFYCHEHSPQYNHLAVSLHNASVHVSVVFVDQASYNELFVTMGENLDDGRLDCLNNAILYQPIYNISAGLFEATLNISSRPSLHYFSFLSLSKCECKFTSLRVQFRYPLRSLDCTTTPLVLEHTLLQPRLERIQQFLYLETITTIWHFSFHQEPIAEAA